MVQFDYTCSSCELTDIIITWNDGFEARKLPLAEMQGKVASYTLLWWDPSPNLTLQGHSVHRAALNESPDNIGQRESQNVPIKVAFLALMRVIVMPSNICTSVRSTRLLSRFAGILFTAFLITGSIMQHLSLKNQVKLTSQI